MKLNWGTALAAVLGIFILGMGTVTYKALNQRHDLVTTDYYEKELAYQETIDAKKMASDLEEPCRLKLEDGKLMLDLPSALEGTKATLKLEMYSPTHAEKDFTLSKEDWLLADFPIPSDKLSSGKWIGKLNVISAEGEYYFEPEIVLP